VLEKNGLEIFGLSPVSVFFVTLGQEAAYFLRKIEKTEAFSMDNNFVLRKSS